jgi:hypothetical protein
MVAPGSAEVGAAGDACMAHVGVSSRQTPPATPPPHAPGQARRVHGLAGVGAASSAAAAALRAWVAADRAASFALPIAEIAAPAGRPCTPTSRGCGRCSTARAGRCRRWTCTSSGP